MKNTIFESLTQAIDEHRLVVITDEAGPRLIEPYLLYESADGDMLLHGWQQAGAFRQRPPPRWCNVHVDEIETVKVLAENFLQHRRDYNPESPKFYRVVYAILPPRSHENRGNGPVRMKRERRGPPSRRASGSTARFRGRFR